MAMTDRELLELISAQVGAITKDVSELKTDVSGLEKGQKKVEDELSIVRRIAIDMEQDHGKKLTLLLELHKQNADKLDRIEKEISKHEEIILRRVK